MERGVDPEIKKYFRKIIFSLFFGLLWLAAGITAGVYFELALFKSNIIATLLFYCGLLISLFFLLRFYIKVWSK